MKVHSSVSLRTALSFSVTLMNQSNYRLRLIPKLIPSCSLA